MTSSLVSRVALAVVTIFFIVMNVLLWRSELLGRKPVAVPPKVVWRRVLENENRVSLDLRYRGQKIGGCVWNVTIEEARNTDGRATSPTEIEGMIRRRAGYRIDLDGHIAMPTNAWVRFHSKFRVSESLAVDNFSIEIRRKPEDDTWNVISETNETVVVLVTPKRGEPREWRFPRDELHAPTKLLERFGVPHVGLLLGTFGLESLWGGAARAMTWPEWEAWTDFLRVGSNLIPAHRLQLRLMEGLQAVIYVQRSGGEIIRVELPGEVVLINELGNYL